MFGKNRESSSKGRIKYALSAIMGLVGSALMVAILPWFFTKVLFVIFENASRRFRSLIYFPLADRRSLFLLPRHIVLG